MLKPFKGHTFVTWAIRVVLGVTFIVSGVSKLIDPWGFIYKIGDYLAVWQLEVPRTVVLAGSIALSSLELILGVLLATGSLKRVAVWASTAFMTAMLCLTAYILIANPVSDCGCFGDFIVLSNGATFLKNVVIMAMLIYLWLYNTATDGLYKPAIQWIIVFLTFGYALTVALIGYNVQPMIDFRPFPVGSSLYVADDNNAEADDIAFVYEKDGQKRTFSADSLPDESWSFVERIESKPTNRHHDSGISIYDGDEDVTDEVLDNDGSTTLLALIPNLRYADISYTYLLNEIARKVESDGGNFYALIASDKTGIDLWRDVALAEYPIYTAEDTELKMIARGNIALVYINNGKIEWKRNIWSVPSDILTRDPSLANPLAQLSFDGPKLFRLLSCALLIAFAAIWLMQTAIVAVTRIRIRPKR